MGDNGSCDCRPCSSSDNIEKYTLAILHARWCNRYCVHINVDMVSYGNICG